MPSPDFGSLVASQRAFFLEGHTRPVAWRKTQLEGVKALFTDHHDELCDALWKDLRRNVNDAELMDVDYCAKEAAYAGLHPGESRPPGVALIIGAWNEPFMLLFGPLVAALAAGNTAVLKPSEIATHCAAAAARLVPKYFDPRAVAVVEGAVPETTALLAQKWDMIFFTGSPPVGKRTRSKSSTARTRSRARTTDA